MENVNQDAMLNKRPQPAQPNTGETAQVPDDSVMLNEDYNPTDLAGEVDSGPDGVGVASGSPTMQQDTNNYGNGDSLGNNDGTEPDPTLTDTAQ
ncbi:hypothetical protein [Spirosoma spitsbergense]|uniref:hypothetical protein n=1 Tax=Spirosoma spitsbergense TaxID=431554 RepID=UPI00035F6950|nr:hypothetical protein [Spirosoma spitsbergense]